LFYRRRISLRGFALFVIDLALIALGVFAAHVVYYVSIEPTLLDGWVQAQLWFVERLKTLFGAMAIHSVVNFASGLYDPTTIASARRTSAVSAIAVAAASVAIVLIFYAKLKLHYGRGILLLAALCIWVMMIASRWFYRRIVGTGFFSRPTLLVGEDREAENILSLIARDEAATCQVFGIVTTRAAEAPAFVAGVPILGGMDHLRDFVRAYDIQIIVVTASMKRQREVLRELRPLRYTGVELLDYASLHERLAMSIPLDHVDDEWLMHAASNSSRIHIRKLKRILDVSVSLVGLLLSLPLSLLAMLLIRLDSPGPVLYRQRRTGQNGEVFTLVKFRTMRADAEAGTGAVWAEKFDRRITRVGRFLRTTRIDEIPQLVNVLRGDMSLVGPRPERPEFVRTLREQIPFYEERLLVPPGVTGWAQISAPYAASVDAARNKLEYDLYYIKHMSLLLDLTILLKTVKTILVGLRHSDDAKPSGPALGEESPGLRVLPGKPGNSKSQTA
jgi:exopolysaccharide biosynthesis polyprenyl glycosylphosphotransferase